MARPHKIGSELRNELIQVRVTMAEKAALEQKAHEAELSVSDFLRALITMKRIRQPSLSLADRDMTRELHRIGVNLNQVARALNSGAPIDAHLAEIIRAVGEQMMDIHYRFFELQNRRGAFKGL